MRTGNIFLNFVGAVHVSRTQTTEQAQVMIAKKLIAGGFFRDPQVSVFAKEYATQGVSVLGEVQKPGVYPLLGSRHCLTCCHWLAAPATRREDW